MTYETDKIENIKKFIECVSIEFEVQRRMPTSFNVFDLCGINHYETTHSAIIAGLLGWKGNRKSLECFIHHFSNIQLSEQELESASVETEKSININGEQRRLDILIRINNRILIIIENKIFTSDHDQQLQAYSNWINNQDVDEKFLIYLTLYGSKSTEGCPENEYKCLSYQNDIIHWLKECSSFTEFDMRYHLALFQYQEFWEKWFMETNELNKKIIQLIISNSTSFNSAKQIAADFGKARIRLLSSTLQEWQNAKVQKCADLKDKVKTKELKMDGSKFEQIFFRLNCCFDFGFEFYQNFSNLYYGVRLKELEEYNIETIEGEWGSSPWWPAYKYIDDSKVRYLGENEHLCIDSKDYIFSVLDTAFEEMNGIIQNEQFTRVQGAVDIFYEKLNSMDIKPFNKIEPQDDGSARITGAKLGNDTFGISFLPRLKGFKIIIWESNNFDPQIIANALNTYSKLCEIFPNMYKGDNRYWEHLEIISFDSIIDWLKGLLELLISLQ